MISLRRLYVLLVNCVVSVRIVHDNSYTRHQADIIALPKQLQLISMIAFVQLDTTAREELLQLWRCELSAAWVTIVLKVLHLAQAVK